jgi:hypothetical protein
MDDKVVNVLLLLLLRQIVCERPGRPHAFAGRPRVHRVLAAKLPKARQCATLVLLPLRSGAATDQRVRRL